MLDDADKQGEKAYTTHGDERKRSLVLAAYQLIAERGFEELRTREVAKRAGVNIATLHYYFARKEDLIAEVVAYLLALFRSMGVEEGEMEDATPLEHLRLMFLSLQKSTQESPEMFVVLAELVLRSLRDHSIQSALLQMDDEWRKYLRWVIGMGIGQGEFRQGLDVEKTVDEIIVILKGATYHQIATRREVDFLGFLEDVKRILTSPE
ncbi:TetR/AcrR family transcriptional regulator [Ktedonosporobacter rubrisoli]|nr:TetR/AcrR family transcriptional regulator [Ktedonosporobacter rubrisoli]